MLDEEPTVNDFEIGQIVTYYGMIAIVSGFTFHPETYEIDGITLDQDELGNDDIVVRDYNYKYLKKI